MKTLIGGAFAAALGLVGLVVWWGQFLMVLAIVVLANVISSFIHTSIDLTGDKRYTLTKPTKELLRSRSFSVLV